LLSGVAMVAACAGPAAAQDGAGLYEPFPEPPRSDASRDFLAGLSRPGPAVARDLSDAQLRRGFRVSGRNLPAGAALPARAAVGPADRAYPGGHPEAVGWTAALGLAVVALAVPAFVRSTRA
jgi:hypothetical protein